MSSAPINPIIPGFSPDPSVVLVDGTFFLVNSSFHMFPGLPIYASRDLTSWKHIGNAIHRQSQLSLNLSATVLTPRDDMGDIMLGTGGLYAPTIRYHDGSFFIVCTNIMRASGSNPDMTKNFIISTKDIWSKEWSDPIYFDFHGIDPSIFVDGDGKTYLQGSTAPGPRNKINLFQIDLNSGTKLSEEKTIWPGTGGIYPEGPHLYKKDGFYYLMISEGGTFEDHSITVSRSNDIWGPYESYAHNPILTARQTSNYIQYTGHCDFFQDDEGKWWGVCLGVRKRNERFIMGRETFLVTGEWPEGGWPSMNQVASNPTFSDGTKVARSVHLPALSAEPFVDYLYIRDAKLENHKFLESHDIIILTASKGDMSQSKEPVTFVGKRQRLIEGCAQVSMHKISAPARSSLKAGLAYYKDEHRHIKLFYDFVSGDIVFETLNKARSISSRVTEGVEFHDVITFRAQYTETTIQFSYRNGDGAQDWSSFDAIDCLHMTDPDFVGPVIGVYATAQVEGLEVKFENLELDVI